MKFEASTVTKLVITEVERLDPVTVFLEDFGRRDSPTEKNPAYQTAQGKITISCYGQSWTAYWGGMGPRTVAEFVAQAGWDYVLNCLDRGIESRVFTGAALEQFARKCVVERRRGINLANWEQGSIDKDDARKLYDQIEDLRNIETPNECWHHDKILTELFGDEWHHPVQEHALEENYKFSYLRRIVEAVQAALKAHEPVTA